MTAMFPSLPGLDIAVKRTIAWSNAKQIGTSGKEQRAAFWSTPRYQYELTFNVLRQIGFSPNTIQDEVAILTGFFNSMQGSFGSFNFTDPTDSVTRLCRFDQDTLDLEQIVFLAWKGGSSLKLITLK